MLRNLGLISFTTFLQCIWVKRHSFMHGSLQIQPQHLNQIEVWTLTGPLQHLHYFLFQPFYCQCTWDHFPVAWPSLSQALADGLTEHYGQNIFTLVSFVQMMPFQKPCDLFSFAKHKPYYPLLFRKKRLSTGILSNNQYLHTLSFYTHEWYHAELKMRCVEPGGAHNNSCMHALEANMTQRELIKCILFSRPDCFLFSWFLWKW